MPRCLKSAFQALAFAILGASFLFADQISVSSFKGLNNNTNALVIDNNEASDALNVDVTPGGKSVKKASGYGQYKSLSTTRGVHGGWHFFDSTGNDIQLWGSSTSLKSITADGTPLQLISSATLDSTWDCVDTQGNAYCVDSSRDAYIKTNGATMSWYTSPLGTMIEATPDRVVVAGVAASPSTLFVSGSNSFLNYTVGPLTTDPFNEPIAAPGSKLTHLRWACQKLLWWKDASFGYFDFDDQYSASVKTVSDTIGTFDNTSAIDPGGSVWFRGQDGHIWQYDCSGLIKQSVEITPLVQSSGRRTANSWTQTSSSDFGNGSSVFTDTFTSLGDVGLSGFSNSMDSNASWTTLLGSYTFSSGLATASTGVVVGGFTEATLVSSPIVNLSNALVYVGAFVQQNNGTKNSVLNCVGLVNTSTAGYVACLGSAVADIYNADLSQSYVLASYSNDTNYHYLQLSRNLITGAMSIYVDGQILGSGTQTSVSNTIRPYLVTGIGPTNGGGGSYDYVNVRSSTGSYYSAVDNAPNLTSWSTFNSNKITSGNSTQTYFVRASTGQFTVLSSTPVWVSQTNNALVNYATGTYMQFRNDYLVTSSSENPVLNDFTFNWYEGNAVDQAYMTYFDNAIWTGVAYGVGVSSNTYIFKRDLINDLWTPYGFGTGGFLVQNNHLFFGDVSTGGNVFQYGSGTSYNGSAINAYWKSKTFVGTDPFLENNYTQLDTYVKRDQNQTLTASYYLNGSTTTTSYSIVESSSTNAIIVNKKLLPTGKNGTSIAVQYGDNTDSSAWELFGLRVMYTPYPYRPSQ